MKDVTENPLYSLLFVSSNVLIIVADILQLLKNKSSRDLSKNNPNKSQITCDSYGEDDSKAKNT